MPTPTYNLIQEATISGSVTSSVTFTSVPGTYDDLVVVCKGDNALDENLLMRFNSDSGANYELVSSGNVTAVQTADTSIILTAGNETNNYIVCYTIFGYRNTNWRKSVVGNNFTDPDTIRFRGGAWNNTATITAITFSTSAGTNFIAGTVFQLYGIKGSN
jgi:hypothetical protein